jgi:nitrogen fixation protein NifU and related proteins
VSDQLYQKAILDLARAATGHGKLTAPDASVTIDNPLCGDRVTMELILRDGVVAELAHRVRGCALCEASASAIGSHAIGADAARLTVAMQSAAAIIAGTADDGVWPELAIFRPVREHKSRHRCVMLPFEALVKALDQANKL